MPKKQQMRLLKETGITMILRVICLGKCRDNTETPEINWHRNVFDSYLLGIIETIVRFMKEIGTRLILKDVICLAQCRKRGRLMAVEFLSEVRQNGVHNKRIGEIE